MPKLIKLLTKFSNLTKYLAGGLDSWFTNLFLSRKNL